MGLHGVLGLPGTGSATGPVTGPGRRLQLVARRLPELRAPVVEVVRALSAAGGHRRLAALDGAWTAGSLVTADPVVVQELDEAWPRPARVLAALAPLGDRHETTGAGHDVTGGNGQDAPPGAVGGGWIAVLGHALGRGTGRVRVPPPPVVGPAAPAAVLAWHDHVLRHDGETWWVEALDHGDGRAAARGDALAAEAVEAVSRAERGRPGRLRPAGEQPESLARLTGVPDAAAHMVAVERCVTAIRAGDVAQANVCTRFALSLADGGAAAAVAWCALVEQLRPARAALVTGPWGALVSASPELYLDVDLSSSDSGSDSGSGPSSSSGGGSGTAGGSYRGTAGDDGARDGRGPRPGARVASAPIKGTQPAGREAALAASAKDAAENVMIVDLLRNDLSTVCVPGTVDVTSLLRVEPHAGVAHLVSRVEGELDGDALAGTGVGDAVAATFPPASVTGTPKQRATELTNSLEPAARGAHTGAVGLVSPRRAELAVTIRSLEVAADGRAALGVGGGIVADSTPAEEWAEVLAKAAPVLRALGAEAPVPAAATRGAKGLADPGRGLIDTVLVVDGRAIEPAGHLARLRRSYWEAYGTALAADLEEALASCCAALGRGAWRVRLRAEPGTPGDVAVEPSPWRRPVPVDTQPGLVLAQRPGPRDGLERHKYADRTWLDSAWEAAGEDAGAGVDAPAGSPAAPDDVAFLDPATGGLLETTRANLVAVVEGRLVTAPTDGRILPGVTRQVLVDVAVQSGVAVELAAPGREVVRRASGLLAVNALRGIEWVRALGPLRWQRPDPLGARLARAVLARWDLGPPVADRSPAGG